MYRNWKIKKSDLLAQELHDKLAQEQSDVADWCNENQQYRINDNEEYIFVEPIPEPTTEEKQEQVRQVRNTYLKDFVDPIVSNPLRWADMTAEEQQIYADYRRYLLDYTNGENWWESYPKTLEEWRDGLGETA
jgi:hypothetical protein